MSPRAKKPVCPRCNSDRGYECSCEMTDRFVLARNEMNSMYDILEALAFYAAKPKGKRGAWYTEVLGGEPKNMADMCLRIREIVKQKAIRIGDNNLCNDNCKSLYFCERKIGHKGKHKDGGLAW